MDTSITYRNVTFQFEAGQLPPPFCYRYTLIIKKDKDNFEVEFAIDYYDRQEISEEEILAEGFSMEDDFYWKGKLPNAWNEVIIQQFQELDKSAKGNKGHLSIYTEDENGDTINLIHNNPEMLEYFLQELIQGIYELNGKQEPLLIKAVDQQGNATVNYNLTISFLDRNATLKKNKEQITIPWSNTKKIMEQIFGLDYDPFNAGKKLPKQKGFFIDPGEGLWYRANETVKVLDSDEDAEKFLKAVFNMSI